MLRSYRKSDKETLVEIFKLNTPKYFDEKEILDYEEFLDNDTDSYFTIIHEGKIVGGIGYNVEEVNRTGSITWIFLHPDFARFGLGSEAMKHCLNILKSNPKVETLVVKTSQLSYEFFEKFGYTLIRASKDYWGKGLDLYLMEQHIKGSKNIEIN